MSIALDPDVCYRALQTRDRRFDGRFFTAVRSTGIFCRPVCPATVPKRENCTFYRSAAAAQQAGYRPCLRCRPELAPQLWATADGSDVVPRALQLIGAGALDELSVSDLANRLGVSDRYLRRRFAEDLGTAPSQVAKTRRLLFAKQLITDTTLTMTAIAIATGFKSIRSFNRALQQTYGCPPTDLRRHRQTASAEDPITLKLPFSPPYNWEAIAAFYNGRATPGLTSATPHRYGRTIELEGHQGWISVGPVPDKPYLQAQIAFPQVSLLAKIVTRLQRMFDLTANGAAIEQQLQQDPIFQSQFQTGLRIPGAWDAFELAVRAIVGQQVSVVAANRLFERIVTRYGQPLSIPAAPPELRYVFPQPTVLAAADLTEVGVMRPRAIAIATLAQTVADTPAFFDRLTTLEAAVTTLCQFPGIGPWTAHYIAMRALQIPDAFPPGDSGLLRGIAALGEPLTKAQLQQRSAAWQPWRAYAAMQLWAADSQAAAHKSIQPSQLEVLSA
ncbi:MAG: AlkA N-terminal domain-containing protein [Cyanobacteria bacterium P01_D01_bin.44]